MVARLTNDEIAVDTIKRFEAAETRRGTLDSHAEEIAQRIYPNYSGTFRGRDQRFVQGSKRTQNMVDTTGVLALDRSASALESFITPRNSRWHGLMPSLLELRKDRLVRQWFDKLTDTLFQFRYAAKANYASQKRQDYMSLLSFGTGCMFTDEMQGREGGFLYKSIHLGEFVFEQNFQGLPDTFLRKIGYTARQSLQKFKREDLPREIIEDAENKTNTTSADKMHWFIHCIKPRTEAEGFDPERVDVNKFPFTDWYVSITGKKLVQEGGHNTFPVAISRYDVAPGELYGRSPAMNALPSLKTLNSQKKTLLKQSHRAADPVLLTHDDGVMDGLSMKPGRLNPGGVNKDGKPLVHALPTGQISFGQEMITEERTIINDFFLINLFQILIETPTMTATEVLERAKEKGAMLTPTAGRQETESLSPQIEREIDILVRQGLVEPMPGLLREAQGEYTVVYTNPLARSVKAESAAGFMRTMEWMGNYAAVSGDKNQFDHLDIDEIAPDLMDIEALPKKWQRAAEGIKILRDNRAEQVQQQQLIEAAPSLASAAKTANG